LLERRRRSSNNIDGNFVLNHKAPSQIRVDKLQQQPVVAQPRIQRANEVVKLQAIKTCHPMNGMLGVVLTQLHVYHLEDFFVL